MTQFIPESYAYQEGIGQPPQSLRLGIYRIHFVTGVPPDTLGTNGDVAFRSDGTVAGGTVHYHKEGGTWVAF